MRRLTSWIAGIALLTTIPLAAQEPTEAEPPGLGANILITVTTGEVEVSGEKINRRYRLMARDRGDAASLLMGWRTPIPSTTTIHEDGEDKPLTSYVYQNIGLTTTVETVIQEDGRILLVGQIELSGNRDEPPVDPGMEGMPIIVTFQQRVNVLLTPGKTTRIAEVPDHDGGTLFLEITAELMQ